MQAPSSKAVACDEVSHSAKSTSNKLQVLIYQDTPSDHLTILSPSCTMRRTFYGWRQSARAPSNDLSQPQSRAIASGAVTSNNDTSVRRSIEQQPAAKRSRMDFEDDDNDDLGTSGFGDIYQMSEAVSL